MPRRKKNIVTEDVTVPTSTAVEETSTATVQEGRGNVIVALNRAQGIIFRLKNGQKIEIAGNAVHLRRAEMGVLPVGAFGLTSVPADAWDEIKATYGDTALFKSGRIYASDTKREAVSEAAQRKDTRHGLEPAKNRQTKAEEAAAVI